MAVALPKKITLANFLESTAEVCELSHPKKHQKEQTQELESARVDLSEKLH